MSRTAGGVTTSYLYDGERVLLEKQGSTTVATYSYGNALVRKDGAFPLYDGQGSERAVTDSSQSVTYTQDTSAFGRVVGTSGSNANPYQWAGAAGYRTDGDGPSFNHKYVSVGARYYDALFGTSSRATPC